LLLVESTSMVGETGFVHCRWLWWLGESCSAAGKSCWKVVCLSV